MKAIIEDRIKELNKQADEIQKRMDPIEDLDSDEYKELEIEQIANNGAIGEAHYLLSQSEISLKAVMLEAEMEKYLSQNGYTIEDEEGTDSTLVVQYALEELGYESYILESDGQKLDQTLIFVKKEEQ